MVACVAIRKWDLVKQNQSVINGLSRNRIFPPTYISLFFCISCMPSACCPKQKPDKPASLSNSLPTHITLPAGKLQPNLRERQKSQRLPTGLNGRNESKIKIEQLLEEQVYWCPVKGKAKTAQLFHAAWQQPVSRSGATWNPCKPSAASSASRPRRRRICEGDWGGLGKHVIFVAMWK